MGKVSPILVTLTSRSDSDFKRSNISFNENKLDDIDLSSDSLTTAFERTKEKFYGFRQTELADTFNGTPD